MVVKVDVVQAAIHSLICGTAHEDLPPGGEPNQGLCQAHHIPTILDLPCHVMYLKASTNFMFLRPKKAYM